MSILLGDALESLQWSTGEAFWKHQFDIAENTIEDFKNPELPLARVKRVMKTDPEVAVGLVCHFR